MTSTSVNLKLLLHQFKIKYSKDFKLHYYGNKIKFKVDVKNVSARKCRGIHLTVRRGMSFIVMDRCRKEVAGKRAEKTT